jgi:hypothetical protein
MPRKKDAEPSARSARQAGIEARWLLLDLFAYLKRESGREGGVTRPEVMTTICHDLGGWARGDHLQVPRSQGCAAEMNVQMPPPRPLDGEG